MTNQEEERTFFKGLKRFLYMSVIRPAFKIYWFLRRPKTKGTRVVVQCGDEVLFVQLGYAGKGWTFPGGGVGRHESFKEGALRELREEVGINAHEAEFFLEYTNRHDYKRDTVQCFIVRSPTKEIRIDGFEIINAVWALPASMPDGIRPGAKQILSKYNEWQRNHA